jgi:hypothetical protein
MVLLHILVQADWTRAARFWILVAAMGAAWESAYHFRKAVTSWLHKGKNHV